MDTIEGALPNERLSFDSSGRATELHDTSMNFNSQTPKASPMQQGIGQSVVKDTDANLCINLESEYRP